MTMDTTDNPPTTVQEPTDNRRGRPFEPGKSGNPNGRPKGRRNKATIAMEELLEGESAALARKVIEKALDGDMGALRLCFERLLPPRRDRPVTFELPKIESVQDASQAASAVLAACAAGNLSPGEATEIMGLISSYVRTLETTKIAEELAALEKEQQS
jgi:hypothetical protein